MADSAQFKIGLDSCIIIDLLDKVGEFYTSARPLIDNYAEKGLCDIVVSTVAIAEIIPAKNTESISTVERFFDFPYVTPVALDETIGKTTRLIREKYTQLEFCDASHIATALHVGCSAFLTRDGEKKPPRKYQPPLSFEKVEIEGKSIRIVTPQKWLVEADAIRNGGILSLFAQASIQNAG